MKITKSQLKQIIKEELNAVLSENHMVENLDQIKKYKSVVCNKSIQKVVLKVLQSEPGSISEKMVLAMLRQLAPEDAQELVEMVLDMADSPEGRDSREELARILNDPDMQDLIASAFEAAELLCGLGDIPDFGGLLGMPTTPGYGG
jgi:hypothetical protein